MKRRAKQPPRWMNAFGSVRYLKQWKGYSVYVGDHITSESAWFANNKDLLISPWIEQHNKWRAGR